MDIRMEFKGIVDSIIEQAHKFYDFRYQMSNGGNLSARTPGMEYMIVKATDIAFSEVEMDTLVVTDFNSNVVEGNLKPSKETLLHGAIYQNIQDVMAVMHCHSPWATAWAARHDTLELSTYHSNLKLREVCPVFDAGSYIVPATFLNDILKSFQEYPQMNSFILRGHGQVTLGKSMREAAMLAELVEETAQIAMLSKI